ncbi:MAG: hypothetical protein SFW62_07490 [Alphaproteobacteria bacterium]|nr:hypothetical protein [Alphaproteobacteria bacterium]
MKNPADITPEDLQAALEFTFVAARLTDENLTLIIQKLGSAPQGHRQYQYELLFKLAGDFLLKRLGLDEEFSMGEFSLFDGTKIPQTPEEFRHAVKAICERSLLIIKDPMVWEPKLETLPPFDDRPAGENVAEIIENTEPPPDIGFAIRKKFTGRPDGLVSMHPVTLLNFNYPSRMS